MPLEEILSAWARDVRALNRCAAERNELAEWYSKRLAKPD
jgi:hypothetical protein